MEIRHFFSFLGQYAGGLLLELANSPSGFSCKSRVGGRRGKGQRLRRRHLSRREIAGGGKEEGGGRKIGGFFLLGKAGRKEEEEDANKVFTNYIASFLLPLS